MPIVPLGLLSSIVYLHSWTKQNAIRSVCIEFETIPHVKNRLEWSLDFINRKRAGISSKCCETILTRYGKAHEHTYTRWYGIHIRSLRAICSSAGYIAQACIRTIRMRMYNCSKEYSAPCIHVCGNFVFVSSSHVGHTYGICLPCSKLPVVTKRSFLLSFLLLQLRLGFVSLYSPFCYLPEVIFAVVLRFCEITTILYGKVKASQVTQSLESSLAMVCYISTLRCW